MDTKEVIFNDSISFGEKKSKIKDFGIHSAKICSFFFEYISQFHIVSSYKDIVNDSTLLFYSTRDFSFKIKILNNLDERNSKLFGKKEFEPLQIPIYEFHFGDSENSVISESHIVSLNLATIEDVKNILRISTKVNAVLRSFFERRNVHLVELFLKFGKADDKILLTGDFSSVGIGLSGSEIDSFSFKKNQDSNSLKKYTHFLTNLISKKDL